jgi:deoxyadenosine/deoxycytidine kinase
MIISIDGNIGSGKSTLFNNLKEYYRDNDNIIFFEEPIEEWMNLVDDENNSMLQKFYNDKNRYSFSFQIMVFITIFSKLRKLVNENPNKIIITERSLLTSKFVFAEMLYQNGHLEKTEYLIFEKLVNEFIEEIPVDYIIYLKSDPELCYNRIQERNRSGENNIDIFYLINLELYHNLFIERREYPTLELNARYSPEFLCGTVINYFF